MVASAGGVPEGTGLDSPVVDITAPVPLRGDVQAERLGGGFSRHPEVVRRVVSRPVDVTGQRRLPVVAVSPGGHVGGAARVGQGGIKTLWSRRQGWSGAGLGPGEGRGEGRGRWGSAWSPGQRAVTQRDAVEALT